MDFIHSGLRGIFYSLKKLFATLFLICLGALLGIWMQRNLEEDVLEQSEKKDFLIAFVIVLFGSMILWLVFKVLHSAWVDRHLRTIRIDLLEQLKEEGLVDEKVVERARKLVRED